MARKISLLSPLIYYCSFQGGRSVVFSVARFDVSFDTVSTLCMSRLYEPRSEKTGLRGFRPGPTKTGLQNHWI